MIAGDAMIGFRFSNSTLSVFGEADSLPGMGSHAVHTKMLNNVSGLYPLLQMWIPKWTSDLSHIPWEGAK